MDPKQLAVYEEFARNVPGFLPSNDLSQPTGFLAQPMKVQPLSFMEILYGCHIGYVTYRFFLFYIAATGMAY